MDLHKIVMTLACIFSTSEFGHISIYKNSIAVNECELNFAQRTDFLLGEVKNLIQKFENPNNTDFSRLAAQVQQLKADINQAHDDKERGEFCDRRDEATFNLRIYGRTELVTISCESNKYGRNWMSVANLNATSIRNVKAIINRGFSTQVENGHFFVGLNKLITIINWFPRGYDMLMVLVDFDDMESYLFKPELNEELVDDPDYLQDLIGGKISTEPFTEKIKKHLSTGKDFDMKIYIRPK